MQIHGLPAINAGNAISSKPVAAGSAAAAVTVEQPLPKDQVTLSQAARQMSAAIASAPNVSAEITSIENSINSGEYTVIAEALSGHLVTLFVY